MWIVTSSQWGYIHTFVDRRYIEWDMWVSAWEQSQLRNTLMTLYDILSVKLSVCYMSIDAIINMVLHIVIFRNKRRMWLQLNSMKRQDCQPSHEGSSGWSWRWRPVFNQAMRGALGGADGEDQSSTKPWRELWVELTVEKSPQASHGIYARMTANFTLIHNLASESVITAIQYFSGFQ
jgi:hypothetical protein